MRWLEGQIETLWNREETNGASGVLAAALLRLCSLPYAAAVHLRNGLYDRGGLRQERLPVPVISVGNLTVGGTGKTPTAILLANLLRESGRRPTVLSRGYGGRAKAPVNVVSDGERLLLGWREAGDEPMLIAQATPGVPVLTGARRILTGRTAVDRFGADVLILDDGLQHRSLARDLEILLVDAARPFGNGFLLPRGPLREGSNALRRAHMVIRTGPEEAETPPLPGSANLPVFRGVHRPAGLVEAPTGRMQDLSSLRGTKVLAFAGIGRPEAFRRTLAAAGVQVVAFRAFADHHPYGAADVDTLRRLALETGAEHIVTTEKDAVRLADFPPFLAELLLLRVIMEIAPAEAFRELIFSRLGIK